MLQSVNDLRGFAIMAADAEVGRVEEFFFEDSTLAVRFLVADTGSWAAARRNLISPLAISHLDLGKRTIHVSLTKAQILNSPGVEEHQPVSRQMEKLVSDYYRTSNYRGVRPDLTAAQLSSANAAAANAGDAPQDQDCESPETAQDVHLRSIDEVTGYAIEGTDGNVGELDDFYVDTRDWSIQYVGVDTRRLWVGKHVLISTAWFGRINWSERKVSIGLTRSQIRTSPDFDKVTEISREYANLIDRHFVTASESLS